MNNTICCMCISSLVTAVFFSLNSYRSILYELYSFRQRNSDLKSSARSLFLSEIRPVCPVSVPRQAKCLEFQVGRASMSVRGSSERLACIWLIPSKAGQKFRAHMTSKQRVGPTFFKCRSADIPHPTFWSTRYHSQHLSLSLPLPLPLFLSFIFSRLGSVWAPELEDLLNATYFN